MIAIDASPLLALRLRHPTAGVEDVLALRALFAHQHETFFQAVSRYDLDQAVERWTEDAIVWMPDRMPVSGRTSIRRLLVDDGFADAGPIQMRDLRLGGTTAYEAGSVQAYGRRLDYLALWTRSPGGAWRICREIWDA
jgi:ketosteroid isomerase-like protein